ncbi:MAG: hypothetical protein ACYDCO_12735 [Armatimonadota bacterium]
MTTTDTLFSRAARVFDGWQDEETGLQVLYLTPKARMAEYGMDTDLCLTMPYQQNWPFLEGGRKVMLRTHGRVKGAGRQPSKLLDLQTGEIRSPWEEPGWFAVDCNDRINTISYRVPSERGMIVGIREFHTGKDIARHELVLEDDWKFGNTHILADGRRSVFFKYRGKAYDEHVSTRTYLLDETGTCPEIISAEGYMCNHYWYNPADPDLFAYNRWPCPKRDVDQVTHVCSADGSFHRKVELSEDALRPADMWGVRDHFIWTADGKHIVSYLCPHPIVLDENFNHFLLNWHLSALDWRTGEDLCAAYPEDRWNGLMQTTPDSRYVVCAGRGSFRKLYAVDIEGLREGWNERVICNLPHSEYQGKNGEPMHMPVPLPDGSGVLFDAGWPGDEYGTYLVEWPADLRSE